MNIEKKNDFNDLFVFDLANNHQGSVEHGLSIIKEIGTIVAKHDVRGVFKFQFRDLDTFIHPSHKNNSDNKHIPRFLSTKLDEQQFGSLLNEVKSQNMISMVTPFDEKSVELALELDFEILKIASCSAKDWPLLDVVAATGKPVIFSTGGLKIDDIDNLVSFFEHKGTDFAIMHCVSIYPTPSDMCELNQIELLIKRYPGRVIGWSTHENPDDKSPILVAYAKGARIFERHVGKETEEIKLNAYSSTPKQVDNWLSAYHEAVKLCGHIARPATSKAEIEGINSLKRGVYASKQIKKGQKIERDQVYFSMPCDDGQLSSGEWAEGIIATDNHSPDAQILNKNVELPSKLGHLVIKKAIHKVKALLNEAGIVLGTDFEVEYSHHYGMETFDQTGCVIIDCVNREYCKKLIVQLPEQSHPLHYHKRKEETFQVLYGELFLELDGRAKLMKPGDSALVMPGVWHRFWTDTGAIVEEISTTHFNDDSIYKDPKIQNVERSFRKTKVDNWGRYELADAEEKQ